MVSLIVAYPNDDSKTDLKYNLSKADDISILAHVSSKSSLYKALSFYHPDLLLLESSFDIVLEEAEFAKIKSISPGTYILIVSCNTTESFINKMIEIGAKGYVDRACSAQEMINAVHICGVGKNFFCSKALEMMFSSTSR